MGGAWLRVAFAMQSLVLFVGPSIMRIELPISLDRGEVLVLAADSDPVRGYALLSVVAVCFNIQEWSHRAGLGARRSLSHALGLRGGGHEPTDTRTFLDLLLERIEGQCPDLVLCRRERIAVSLDLRPVEDELVDLADLAGDEPSPSVELGWIEIRLRDQDERPIPNLRYEVRLPDRGLRWGYLDHRGQARVEDIPEGQCTVSFPDCDRGS